MSKIIDEIPEIITELQMPGGEDTSEDDELGILSEQETYSYSDIYDKLMFADELILVINENDLKRLKNGLSVVKNAALNKLKEAGFDDDGKKLRYIPMPNTKDNPVPAGRIMIKILLEAPKSGIVVHQIIIPEKE